MRMALWAGAIVFVLFRSMGNGVIVSVMMNRSVTVDVSIAVESGVGVGNLSNIFKAVGSDSAVRERQSNRRQDTAHEIK